MTGKCTAAPRCICGFELNIGNGLRHPGYSLTSCRGLVDIHVFGYPPKPLPPLCLSLGLPLLASLYAVCSVGAQPSSNALAFSVGESEEPDGPPRRRDCANQTLQRASASQPPRRRAFVAQAGNCEALFGAQFSFSFLLSRRLNKRGKGMMMYSTWLISLLFIYGLMDVIHTRNGDSRNGRRMIDLRCFIIGRRKTGRSLLLRWVKASVKNINVPCY